MMKQNKKIGKFNLLEEEVCVEQCKCGWNLHIGGKDTKDLVKIKEYLENFGGKKNEREKA